MVKEEWRGSEKAKQGGLLGGGGAWTEEWWTTLGVWGSRARGGTRGAWWGGQQVPGLGTEDQGMLLMGTKWNPDADSRDPKGQRVGDKRGWWQEETPLERARAGTQTVQGSEGLFGLPPTL